MFMGQYLKGNNMAPMKSIMADVMRMRKFLMFMTINYTSPNLLSEWAKRLVRLILQPVGLTKNLLGLT